MACCYLCVNSSFQSETARSMKDQRNIPGLRRLLNDMLGDLRGVRGRSAIYAIRAASEVESIAKRDYRRPLRKLLSRTEVREVISEARRVVWLQLNRQPVTGGPPRLFLQRWSSLEIDFRLANFTTREGLGLLGFYLGKNLGLSRPLICVNTAHPQAAVCASFAHEMGHHVVCEIFHSGEDPHFFSLSGYDEHLEDAQELAADVLLTLGAYPRRIVPRLSSHRAKAKGKKARDSDTRLSPMLSHMAERYSFRLDETVSRNRLLYLAWAVHYVKLRLALLDEYDL